MRKAVLACPETSSLAIPATQVRQMTRLGLLHKAVHNRAAITIPSHVQYKSSSATRNISIHLNSLLSRLHEILAKFSFWPSKINDWNSLPPNILEIDPTDNFKPVLLLNMADPLIFNFVLYYYLFHFCFILFYFIFCLKTCDASPWG